MASFRGNSNRVAVSPDDPGEMPSLVVGQTRGIFSKGARFDGMTRPHIPEPPPGCSPNSLQKMKSGGTTIVLHTKEPAQSTSRRSKNKVAPGSGSEIKL